MKLPLVERLVLNEFKNPLNPEKGKIHTITDIRNTFDKIEDAVTKAGYVFRDQGNKGFYILPKNKYLSELKITFTENEKLKIDFYNTLGKLVITNEYSLKDNTLSDNDIASIVDIINSFVPTVKNNIITEANIFDKVIQKLGNTLTARQNVKDYKARCKQICDQINKSISANNSGLIATSTSIDEGNKSFTIQITKDKGASFILAVSLSVTSNGNLIADAVIGCRNEDRVDELYKKSNYDTLQKVLTAISKKLNINLVLDSEAAKMTGSSDADIENQTAQNGTVKAKLASKLSNINLRTYFESFNSHVLTEEFQEEKVKNLLKSSETKLEDKLLLLKLLILNKVDDGKLLNDTSINPDKIITDDAANKILKACDLDNNITGCPIFNFAVNYLKKFPQQSITSKHITVLTDRYSKNILNTWYNNSNTAIYDPAFWNFSDAFNDLTDLLTLIYEIEKSDFTDVQIEDEKRLADEYGINSSNLQKIDLYKKGEKYRSPKTIREISNLIITNNGKINTEKRKISTSTAAKTLEEYIIANKNSTYDKDVILRFFNTQYKNKQDKWKDYLFNLLDMNNVPNAQSVVNSVFDSKE